MIQGDGSTSSSLFCVPAPNLSAQDLAIRPRPKSAGGQPTDYDMFRYTPAAVAPELLLLDSSFGVVRDVSLVQSRFIGCLITVENVFSITRGMTELEATNFAKKLLGLIEEAPRIPIQLLQRLEHLWTGPQGYSTGESWGGRENQLGKAGAWSATYHLSLDVTFYLSAKWELVRELAYVAVDGDARRALADLAKAPKADSSAGSGSTVDWALLDSMCSAVREIDGICMLKAALGGFGFGTAVGKDGEKLQIPLTNGTSGVVSLLLRREFPAKALVHQIHRAELSADFHFIATGFRGTARNETPARCRRTVFSTVFGHSCVCHGASFNTLFATEILKNGSFGDLFFDGAILLNSVQANEVVPKTAPRCLFFLRKPVTKAQLCLLRLSLIVSCFDSPILENVAKEPHGRLADTYDIMSDKSRRGAFLSACITEWGPYLDATSPNCSEALRTNLPLELRAEKPLLNGDPRTTE